MVRKTLHSPFFTSVPRNSNLANKPGVGGGFILPEDKRYDSCTQERDPDGKF